MEISRRNKDTRDNRDPENLMYGSGLTTLIVETTMLWLRQSRTIEENGIPHGGVIQLIGDPSYGKNKIHYTHYTR